MPKVIFTHGGTRHLLGVSGGPDFYGIWRTDDAGGPPTETWPLDDVSWAVALGRLNALDTAVQEFEQKAPTDWSARTQHSTPPPLPRQSVSLPLLVPDPAVVPNQHQVLAPEAGHTPSASSQPPTTHIGLTINPTAPQKELTNCGVSIVAGGLLLAITLFVKFGTHYIAPFHAGYDVLFTTVLAAGIVVAGLLLCSARTALLGVGAVLAPVAVLDAYFLGDVAALATPGRGYGWGFWILGLAAAFTNVAVLQAVREVNLLGRLKKPVERPPAGWIAASVIFGFLVAIGVGLPHRVETVFTFQGTNGLHSLGSLTLRGGLDQASWVSMLTEALYVVIALLLPLVAGITRDRWLATGNSRWNGHCIRGNHGEIAMELGSVAKMDTQLLRSRTTS